MSLFEPNDVIFAYTRKQAIEDGVLIDVTATAREAGFKHPTVITDHVMSAVVRPTQWARDQGQSESGRLWDVLFCAAWEARAAIRRNDAVGRVGFEVITIDDDSRTHKTHHLILHCGPGDDGEPVLTIMFPEDD